MNDSPFMAKDTKAYIKHLEDLLFEMGAMNNPPCFRCGYNGPGYFQPENHACAERHYELYSDFQS